MLEAKWCRDLHHGMREYLVRPEGADGVRGRTPDGVRWTGVYVGAFSADAAIAAAAYDEALHAYVAAEIDAMLSDYAE